MGSLSQVPKLKIAVFGAEAIQAELSDPTPGAAAGRPLGGKASTVVRTHQTAAQLLGAVIEPT